jgi:hypothetical protein
MRQRSTPAATAARTPLGLKKAMHLTEWGEAVCGSVMASVEVASYTTSSSTAIPARRRPDGIVSSRSDPQRNRIGRCALGNVE